MRKNLLSRPKVWPVFSAIQVRDNQRVLNDIQVCSGDSASAAVMEWQLLCNAEQFAIKPCDTSFSWRKKMPAAPGDVTAS